MSPQKNNESKTYAGAGAKLGLSTGLLTGFINGVANTKLKGFQRVLSPLSTAALWGGTGLLAGGLIKRKVTQVSQAPEQTLKEAAEMAKTAAEMTRWETAKRVGLGTSVLGTIGGAIGGVKMAPLIGGNKVLGALGGALSGAIGGTIAGGLAGGIAGSSKDITTDSSVGEFAADQFKRQAVLSAGIGLGASALRYRGLNKQYAKLKEIMPDIPVEKPTVWKNLFSPAANQTVRGAISGGAVAGVGSMIVGKNKEASELEDRFSENKARYNGLMSGMGGAVIGGLAGYAGGGGKSTKSTMAGAALLGTYGALKSYHASKLTDQAIQLQREQRNAQTYKGANTQMEMTELQKMAAAAKEAAEGDPSMYQKAKAKAGEAYQYVKGQGGKATAAYGKMHPALKYGLPAAAAAGAAYGGYRYMNQEPEVNPELMAAYDMGYKEACEKIALDWNTVGSLDDGLGNADFSTGATAPSVKGNDRIEKMRGYAARAYGAASGVAGKAYQAAWGNRTSMQRAGIGGAAVALPAAAYGAYNAYENSKEAAAYDQGIFDAIEKIAEDAAPEVKETLWNKVKQAPGKAYDYAKAQGGKATAAYGKMPAVARYGIPTALAAGAAYGGYKYMNQKQEEPMYADDIYGAKMAAEELYAEAQEKLAFAEQLYAEASEIEKMADDNAAGENLGMNAATMAPGVVAGAGMGAGIAALMQRQKMITQSAPMAAGAGAAFGAATALAGGALTAYMEAKKRERSVAMQHGQQ